MATAGGDAAGGNALGFTAPEARTGAGAGTRSKGCAGMLEGSCPPEPDSGYPRPCFGPRPRGTGKRSPGLVVHSAPPAPVPGLDRRPCVPVGKSVGGRGALPAAGSRYALRHGGPGAGGLVASTPFPSSVWPGSYAPLQSETAQGVPWWCDSLGNLPPRKGSLSGDFECRWGRVESTRIGLRIAAGGHEYLEASELQSRSLGAEGKSVLSSASVEAGYQLYSLPKNTCTHRFKDPEVPCLFVNS